MFCSECLNCVNKCFVLNVSVKSTSSSHPRSRHQSLECNSLLRSHHHNSSHPCTHITPSIQFSSVHPFLCEVLFVFTTTVLCLFKILPIYNGLPVHRPVCLTNVVSDSQPAPCLDFAYPSNFLCMTSCLSLDPSPTSFLGIVLINILSCSALETYS